MYEPGSTQFSNNSEEVINDTPVLSLPVEDKDLISILTDKIQNSEKYWNKKKLKEKRKLNEDFYLGNQIDESQMHDYQKPVYQDNMIWEDLERKITMASNKLPDIVCAGPDTDAVKKLQDELTRRINCDAGQRIIKDGLRILDLKYTAAVKFRWDPNKGEKGDYVYELCNVDNMVLDHTATIPQDGFTADNMEFIAEWIEEPLALVFSKFPDKKEELMGALGYKTMSSKRYASKIKYLEIWFTWFTDSGEIMEGVCHKYQNIILAKNKNPNWDWEGYDHPFLKEPNPSEIEPKIETETRHVYNNFFERPRKPYIFFSHKNLGKDPMDDTTAVEQTLPLQKIVNKRGRQITEIADATVPKKVFGNGMTKEDAASVTNDPSESLWFNTEDVTKAYGSIAGAPPSPALMQDMQEVKNNIDSKFATHQATKGEMASIKMSGMARQLMMQGDITMADDLVTTVVDRVIMEMAKWAVQMMKVFYDDDHYSYTMGDDGNQVREIINNGLITDGVLVNIKANTIDKKGRRDTAMALLPIKGIDPLSMMEDLDVSNPKEKAKRLLAFMMGEGPNGDGFAKYMQICGLGEETTPNNAENVEGLPSDANNPQEETPVQENIPKG
jgi:hypothetical protein